MPEQIPVAIRCGSLSSEFLAGETILSGGVQVDVDESFSDGDMTIVQPIDVSALKLLCFLSDRSISVDFDASGDPHYFSINLLAGVPWVWHANMGLDNPFSADVTSINFSTTAVPTRVQMTILTDPTP